MLLLEKGNYMFSFDLKSGYHHADIAKEHWKYLGFSWESRFNVSDDKENTDVPYSINLETAISWCSIDLESVSDDKEN